MQYIESLQKYIETQINYTVIGNIKTVLTPEGREWTKNKVWVLLGLYSIDAVQEINVGTLVAEKSEKDWEVLGCYQPKMIKFPVFTLSLIKDYIQAYA